MFLKRSLRAQILALLGGSLLLVVVIALLCFGFMSSSMQSYRDLIDGPILSSRLVNEANVEFKIQVQEWKNVLLRGKNPVDRDKYWQQFQAREASVQQILKQLSHTANPQLQAQVNSLINEHSTMGSAYRKGFQAFVDAGGDATAGDAAVKGIDRDASQKMEALVSQLAKHSHAQSVAIGAQASQALSLGIGFMLISSVIVGLISLWLVNRNLVNPIQQLIEYIAQLSQGNFANRTEINRQDELGRLAVAANTLRDFLAETFNQLQRSTTNLDSASGDLSAIAAIMAQGSRDQFSRTDQVATAMHEMSATAQEVSRHAGEAANAADDADSSAQQGEQVMQATIETITDMSQAIVMTAEVIRQLEGDSGRISKVLEVIRGIAEQTNLLALNAAIEAARAGEAGRGFAVVADEVRTLAQRTAQSTAEINQIISTVQTGASNAVRAIDNGQELSNKGLEQVMQAGTTLQQITAAVEAIRDMNRQIATAAEEQTAVAEDISRNLTEITTIASENEKNVQRTEAASQNLRSLSTGLSDVTQRLSA
uniref:methyl-accepting chemotaxis protein n=2 Tax=Pseudomonas sp. EL_65y_Pfl2_R95 TaxID=3088698 RepID=UPI0030D9E9F7